jgi:hypothetical protein
VLESFDPMAANLTDDKDNGFFAKLKARLNRGKNWLSGELLGLRRSRSTRT